MSSQRTHRCTQEDCPFNNTGVCLENLPQEECSHLVALVGGAIEPDEESILVEPSVPGLQDGFVPVYAAKALEPTEADDLVSEKECTLVVIAGDVDSGKTTMVGRCYTQFLLGEVPDWWYAGSRTLLGFEERSHHHRMASRRFRAATRHTPKGVEHYFHLDLRSVDGSQKRTLLLHDISGEDYQEGMSKSSAAAAFTMIRRADVVSFLLNGQQLITPGSRQRPYSRLMELIRALTQQGLLQHAPHINLIVTCWDQVVHAKAINEVNTYLKKLEPQIRPILDEYRVNSSLTLHRVANITHHKETPAGFGFSDVLASWISTRPKPRPVTHETLGKQGRKEGWTGIGHHQEVQEDE